MEKVNELISLHVSSKFRKPFSEFNKIVNTQIENKTSPISPREQNYNNRKRSKSKENIQ